MNRKIISLFEITMLVMMSFSFAYIIGESNELFSDEYGELSFNKEGKGIKFLREKLLNYFSKGVVSAQSGNALWTCIENNEGTYCQEYPDNTCANNCVNPLNSCLPFTAENTIECQIGTCYDPLSGICDSGAPKISCEDNGGQWSEDIPAECNRNCCLINPDNIGGGDQAVYTTERRCNYLEQTLGAPTSFADPSVSNELECLVLANSRVEGACVLDFVVEEQAYNCQLINNGECISRGGEFFEGKLCTAQDLVIQGDIIDTVCEKTLNGDYQTSCYEDSDEVYFIDSCGNRANIYDSTKLTNIDYWTNIISKENSCSLGNSVNDFSNQDSCGNCNYLGGSICGEPGEDDSNADFGNYVCKDLRCVDYQGETRQFMESWCRFDGQIGVDGTEGGTDERSVDVPGSRHYREVCFDGEVRLEECQDRRNEICVESEDETTGYTSANCRINLWQQCIEANGEQDDLNRCEENTDCFLKHINVDEFYEFDICAPKYPAGWDLSVLNGGEVGESFCSAATQSCTYVEQKGFGGWSCVANCECKDDEFAEQMNNLCMSLGDCGGSINLAGDFTNDGYSVAGGDDLSGSYISGLQQYKNAIPGQKVEPLSLQELAALLGIPDPPEGGGVTAGGVAGWVLGIGGLGMAVSLVIAECIAFCAAGGIAPFSGLTTFSASAGGEGLGGFGPWANWAGAAAVGAAIGFIVALAFGFQGDAILVITLGGAAGGTVAYALGAELLISTGFWAGIGIGIAVAIALVVLFDLGETREKQVDFTCRPWQPPTGGQDCGLCNDDELGCSAYKCRSLGQNCDLINPGTDDESCIDVNPNDATPPVINVWQEAISDGYEYVNDQTNVGTEVEKSEGDGCLKEYEFVNIGLELDEPGQCKWDTEHTANFNEMSNYFGGNLYKDKHEKTFAMPNLDELGSTGIDPGRREDYDLYVRCQDSSGNPNGASSEYVVRFCVKPEDDLTSPVITEFTPESPGFVGLGVEVLNLQFYTNEPATCRWSSEDKDYSLMENDAICSNGINQVTSRGWRCITQLDVDINNAGETEDYYFRCVDQPWLGANNGVPVEGRNINMESQPIPPYQIQITQNPLEIDFVEPNDTIIYSGSQPVIVDLEIHTIGGIDNNAFCEWSLNGGNNYISFFPTGGQVHTFHFDQLLAENYFFDLMCTDLAGNVATSTAEFSIEVDSSGPLITRVYQNGGTLNVVTNEESECRYSNENCAFTFEEGEQMSGQNYLHSISFDPTLTYRVKCQDGFGNVGQCLSVSGGY